MGEQLIKQLIPRLEGMNWPTEAQATQQGQVAYGIGLDKVASYSDDPKTLAEAIRIFQSGGSAPYAYAGVAFVLVAASREGDGSYAETGLEAAMAWLERAQELAPDLVEVNVIEALVYVYNGRFPDARLVLDYLYEQEPDNYHLHLAEVAYWQRQGMVAEAVEAIKIATAMANHPPERLRLRNMLAEIYLEAGQLDEALKLYKEGLHLDPRNPLTWHKLSLVFWEKGNLDEAERANQQALRLGNLPAAQQMAEQIKAKRKGEPGLLGGIFKR
jgi:predicted Zn-dependent protease